MVIRMTSIIHNFFKSPKISPLILAPTHLHKEKTNWAIRLIACIHCLQFVAQSASHVVYKAYLDVFYIFGFETNY